MLRRLSLTFFFLLITLCFFGQDAKITKLTEVYAIKSEADTLRLDKYSSMHQPENSPCLIFMFGGGFMKGDRAREDYVPFFNHLVEKGFVVVSIDYRLGLKKLIDGQKVLAAKAKETGEKLKKTNNKDFLYAFANVIDMATEDLLDATKYVLDKAIEWGIDENTIVACGSSAGAISVLHGEYNICNETKLARRLPEDFRYAGIISFAGAIFSMDGNLKWKNNPAPIQFFHGDADSNVPYDKVQVKILGIPLKYGFYGSKHIVGQMKDMKLPFYFYDVENANHIMADAPMEHCLPEIDIFLKKQVIEKKDWSVETKIKPVDSSKKKKKFTIADYLKANGL